jgi:lipoprotein-releasing system permease protein
MSESKSVFQKQRLGRKVGFRYLTAKKKSGFLSLITVISITGVAVGVATLVVILSVMAGFERELKKRLFDNDAHILIEERSGNFTPNQSMLDEIKNSNTDIQSVSGVLKAEVIVRMGPKVSGAVLKGIDGKQLEWVRTKLDETTLKESELDTTVDGPKVYVGYELGMQIQLMPGDQITVVSPVESDGPFGAVPRMKKFIVGGLFRTGVPEQELHTMFAERGDVESFLRIQSSITQIEIRVNSLNAAQEVSANLKSKLGDAYLVRSWQDLNQHLFQSLKLERVTMFCILSLIILVASFNIISTLLMMVVEKRKSLSILRAIGATPGQIASVFIWEGIAIGFIGVAFGLGLGLGTCYVLKHYPIIELPEFYYDRTLPIVTSASSVATVCLAALVIVFLGSLVPARKSTALTPIEGIRQGNG